jgi:16S rRNA (uracil1498-N3)-methyltransferase
VLPLQQALELERGSGAGVRLVAHPGAPAPDPQTLGPAAAPQRVALLVGPEGGLEPGELSAARERGFAPVGLGPWILRTETAAVALLAVVAHLMGRMDPIPTTEEGPAG